MNNDDDHKRFLRWRGLRHNSTPCPKCNGAGARCYSNGATWRGGMGTASPEWDVCDVCWGSGDADHPWTDIRKMETEEKERVYKKALNLFVPGYNVDMLTPALEMLTSELQKLSIASHKNKDKLCALNFRTICGALIHRIQECLKLIQIK